MDLSDIRDFEQDYIILSCCVCVGVLMLLFWYFRNLFRTVWHVISYFLSFLPSPNTLYLPWLRRQKVQILDQVKTRTSEEFSEALKAWINEFECIDTGTEDLDPRFPLIVVCPRTSRLKPDLELAIGNLPRSSDYAVIILHRGPEKNLPSLSSSTSLSEYKNTIVDVGFDEPAGIYPCSTNNTAKKQLKTYINQFKRN